jgi:Na+-translocating ferredoxin:NAD+ oxidoreductase RnfD subunit
VTLSRFFRTPKGLLIVVLAILTVLAALGEGIANAAPGLAAAIVVAALIDAPILRARESKWMFPDGAMLTGWIVALILSPHEPWYVAAVTAAVGIASKYLARVGSANVFNPAALALVATFYIFDTAQSWWGALPEITPLALIVLFATGIFITHRVNKLPAVLAFLGVYYSLITVSAFAGNPGRVAELYRAPDLHAALFFAFFMVTDPPTSPPKSRDQIIFGAITGVASYAFFELIGAAYFLLAGLLVANAWEASRRWRVRTKRARSRSTQSGLVSEGAKITANK